MVLLKLDLRVLHIEVAPACQPKSLYREYDIARFGDP